MKIGVLPPPFSDTRLFFVVVVEFMSTALHKPAHWPPCHLPGCAEIP